MFTDRQVNENKCDADVKTVEELRREADEIEELERQAKLIMLQVNRRKGC